VTSPAAQPWRAEAAGLRLLVRVTPRSARNSVEGVVETAQGPALAVRVRAVAEKGEANRAVEMAVAAWMGVAKSGVAVAAGGKSRLKTVTVRGEADRLVARLEAQLADLQRGGDRQ
jgi:uncharacterized protein YggU (UPF0235/DUF167 family)